VTVEADVELLTDDVGQCGVGWLNRKSNHNGKRTWIWNSIGRRNVGTLPDGNMATLLAHVAHSVLMSKQSSLSDI